MIAVILSWLLLSLLFISFGDMAASVWNNITKRNDSYSITEKFWIGICFIGTILLYSSIFCPLNRWMLLALIALAITYLLLNRAAVKGFLENGRSKIKNSKLSEKLIFGLALLVILLFSLSTPLIYDEGLYHLQSMQWSEKYKAILGLGNIHGRLGFNSSFLLLSTIFNYAPLKEVLFFSINSLCLLVFCTWLIRKIEKSGKVTHTIVFSIILLTTLFSLGTNASSTSTDILPNIFIMYLLISWALDKDFVKNKPLLLATISIFCITMKLSSAIIVVAALVCIISLFREKKQKTAYIVLALGVIVATPWFIRFFLLTGYLVYPFPSIDLFSVDWKIPLALVAEEKDIAYAWARVPNLDAKEVLAMSFTEWIPLWIDRLSAYNLLIYVLAFVSPLFVVIWRPKGIIPWAIAYMGVIFGLLTAPDFRFGFGFLIAAAAIPFLLLSKQTKYATYPLLTKGVLTVGLVGLIYIASSQLNTYQHLSAEPCFNLLLKPQDIKPLAKRTQL